MMQFAEAPPSPPKGPKAAEKPKKKKRKSLPEALFHDVDDNPLGSAFDTLGGHIAAGLLSTMEVFSIFVASIHM
jgi:hypothetical protein